MSNKKASTSLGLLGVITCIILFELIAGYFIYALTQDNLQNVFVSNCDCDYIGGCSSYVAVNGVNALYDKCESQVQTNALLKDAQANAFFKLTFVGILLVVINLILVLAIIFIVRGIPN